jgi:hypothetical protein
LFASILVLAVSINSLAVAIFLLLTLVFWLGVGRPEVRSPAGAFEQ